MCNTNRVTRYFDNNCVVIIHWRVNRREKGRLIKGNKRMNDDQIWSFIEREREQGPTEWSKEGKDFPKKKPKRNSKIRPWILVTKPPLTRPRFSALSANSTRTAKSAKRFIVNATHPELQHLPPPSP